MKGKDTVNGNNDDPVGDGPVEENVHFAADPVAMSAREHHGERQAHRKPFYTKVAACGILLVVVIMAVLIPTVFVSRGSDSNADAVPGNDSRSVRCRNWGEKLASTALQLTLKFVFCIELYYNISIQD
jgi:hypothetical protein